MPLLPHVFTAQQLADTLAATPRLLDGQRFGRWAFRRANLTLVYLADGEQGEEGEEGEEREKREYELYELDLERIHDSPSMLDWIFQIERKRWFLSSADLGDLLAALRAIYDPQANLCSWERNKHIDPRKHLEKMVANPREWAK